MPTVCRIVARPPMKRDAATSIPISAPVRPAALPTMSGGAMMPPYIVSTCWNPYPNVDPMGSRSSSGRAGRRSAPSVALVARAFIADLLVSYRSAWRKTTSTIRTPRVTCVKSRPATRAWPAGTVATARRRPSAAARDVARATRQSASTMPRALPTLHR
ncbi:Uncharacterised protein [Mycobacteroides abscessus]|nr:Uncharacterised protein [Mycobacteroides abscessus]